MTIPTEPIGSIPRPAWLLAAMAGRAEGRTSDDDLGELYEQAVRETIERLEALGSPVVSDGEQSKPSFATYPVAGSADLAPDGAVIPDRKSTRLNSSHLGISYAVFCLKK